MSQELRVAVHLELEAVADGHAFVIRTEAGGQFGRPTRVPLAPIPTEALVVAGLRMQIGPFDV